MKTTIPDNEKQLLREASRAIRDKKRTQARDLLDRVIEINPQNDTAWVYRAFTIEDREQALDCLRRALEINPHNDKAIQLIQRLEEKIQPASQPKPDSVPAEETGQKKTFFGAWAKPLLITIICVGLWMLIRPGVFVIQPIGALPDGVTVIYHSRGPKMPFFSSPDGLCLQIQGSVSLLCRGVALASAVDITDRVVLRLPYSHWAYLQSTGGREFEF